MAVQTIESIPFLTWVVEICDRVLATEQNETISKSEVDEGVCGPGTLSPLLHSSL
jgi:hypothetical protein